MIRGTTTGGITDANGKYSLNNVPSNGTLVFSFVGMKIQEIPVAGKAIANVKMEEETVGIEEVVAVGYGTMKKSDLTGSIASVSSDQLNLYPTGSILQALQGRASGLQITSTNGSPGSDVRIRVRGSKSINAGNDPLFVVDGFAGVELPPAEDIQSVEILKDASATAIYGSRGANGVLLITTKKGKTGALKIEANTSYSMENIINKVDLLNAAQYGQYLNDVYKNVGSSTVPYPDPSILGEGTDWQDVIFRNGALQNYQFSVSGGSDKIEFYSSVKYYGKKGIILNSDYDKYSVGMSINANISERFKLNMQMQFNRDETDAVATQQWSGVGNGVISSALTFQPDLGIYYEDNTTYTISTRGDPRDNPYALLNDRIEQSVGNYSRGDISLEYKILKDLNFHSSFGAQLNSRRTGGYIKRTLLEGKGVDGNGRIDASTNVELINENYLTYSKTITDLHKLNLMAGYSYQSSRSEFWGAENSGFITDSFLFWNLGSGTIYSAPSSSLTKWKIASFYGRLNYNFNDRYLFTFTGRYDGSSRFGSNNKWAFFPSAAFAWNVRQESFMQQFDHLSHLKLRASYGVTGNTDIGAYNSLAKLGNVPATFNGKLWNAVLPVSVANADLSWESTSQVDVGVDFGLFNERINLTADCYKMITKDLLYWVPLPVYSGYGSTLLNNGQVRNQGVEVSLSAIIVTKALKWEAGFNISFNKNEIIDLPEGDVIWSNSPAHLGNGTATHIRTEGQPIGTFFGYVFDGIYQEEDDFSTVPDKVPGNIKYRDTNGRDEGGNITGIPDGNINSDDRAIVGDPNPNFIFGFNNDFTYKNFDLNIFLNGSVGNDMINFTRMELETMNGAANTTKAYFDAWTPTHTNTNVPSVGNNLHEFSSRWVEDGTYVRIKNITLGYSLQAYLLKQLKISKLRVYISAQNLLTLTKYSGYDPEVSWDDSNSIFGCDYGSYPNVKSYTIGMNIVF